MEEAGLDEDRLTLAFEAAAEIGIPVVNVGPGGKSDVEEDFRRQTDLISRMAEKAEDYGVTLCCKAHVGGSIYNTATTLRAMRKITAPAFGVDMDPSHIYRAGEDPAEALGPVLSRVKHIHIRDCLGTGPSPGAARDQACGRGDIDLMAYCQTMVSGGYDGPVCLEVYRRGRVGATRGRHHRRRELRVSERLPEGPGRKMKPRRAERKHNRSFGQLPSGFCPASVVLRQQRLRTCLRGVYTKCPDSLT